MTHQPHCPSLCVLDRASQQTPYLTQLASYNVDLKLSWKRNVPSFRLGERTATSAVGKHTQRPTTPVCHHLHLNDLGSRSFECAI
jgi:hypothetical protein